MNNSNIDKPTIWNINIPVLKNPLVWFQLLMVAFVVFAFMLVLLLFANLFQYQWDAIPSSVLTALIIGGGIFIVFSLVLIIMYAGGIPTSYVINDEFIEQYTLRENKNSFSLLSLLGIASGKSAGFTAAGASLMAQSRQYIAVKWKNVDCIEVRANYSEIQLKNKWRTVMQVVCKKEQFESIKKTISNKIQAQSQKSKPKQTDEMSFARKLLLSVLVIICGGFLFVRLPIHYVGLLTIATMLMAFLSLYSKGLKKKISSASLAILPIIAVVGAYLHSEVSLARSGAYYALVIEILSIGFFILLGINQLLENHHE